MRHLAALLIVTAAAWSIPAHAGQENIDRAVKDAVTLYRKGGETAMADHAKFCYDSADYARGHDGLARRVEYCYSFDTAAIEILSEHGKYRADHGYFNAPDVITRAAYNLDRARVVTLPEQFEPYIMKRADYIKRQVPGALQRD